MTDAGSDFLAKVQSVIWDSFTSLLKHQQVRDQIARHRAEAHATLHSIGSASIPEHRVEGIERLREKVAANDRSIEIYDLAINIAAGSILQIAKQAISMQHGGLASCPAGRNVSGFYIRDLIWQGRNQSMHYEETLRGQTLTFVERLEKDLPVQFPKRDPASSHAKAILDLMGWSTDLFLIESDMEELLRRDSAGISSS